MPSIKKIYKKAIGIKISDIGPDSIPNTYRWYTKGHDTIPFLRYCGWSPIMAKVSHCAFKFKVARYYTAIVQGQNCEYTIKTTREPISERCSDNIIAPHTMEDNEEMNKNYNSKKLMDATKNILDRYYGNGISRIKYGIEDFVFNTATTKVKTHFGIVMTFYDEGEVDAFTKWVKENDKNFMKHITNAYIYKGNISNDTPILADKFIFKCAKHTWMYVYYCDGPFLERHRSSAKPIEAYVFGKGAYRVFKEISKIQNAHSTTKMIYTVSCKSNSSDSKDSYWTVTGKSMPNRTIDTIFIDPRKKKLILDHIDNWLKNEDIYTERGLTFKTGLLFHGTAGTGKTSLAIAIANYLNCDIIQIDTASFQNLNIADVVECINADNDRYVVLIDEIDTIFKSRDEELSETQQANTSKLLSLLDSSQSPNNVVFVGTTNYRDRLDKAVTRKGRFNIDIELGNIDRELATEMCKSFNLSAADTRMILDSISDNDKYNPCELESAILEAKK